MTGDEVLVEFKALNDVTKIGTHSRLPSVKSAGVKDVNGDDTN